MLSTGTLATRLAAAANAAKAMSARQAASMPAYGLNSQLSIHTPQPPVPMAKAWAASYPSSSSPFRRVSNAVGRDGHATTSAAPVQPLLNLAQGVPGHAPHSTLLRRMDVERDAEPMETHGYGGVFGDDGLRKALADDIGRVYGGNVCADDVAITAGCNLAAAVTFHALAGPGESVVLPTPWYFNHQMTLASLGINVVPLQAPAPSFRPSPTAFEQLLQAHNSRSDRHAAAPIKALVLVTPNNPTGSIYPPQLLAQFAQICQRWNVALIVDETYRDFLLQGDAQRDDRSIQQEPHQQVDRPLARPHSLFAEAQAVNLDWRDTVISLHSFSKSYAIPGHRLGAIIAHPALLIRQDCDDQGRSITRFGSFAKSLDNMQICPPRTDTQRAVATCIADNEHQSWRLSIANDLGRRRKTFLASLDDQLTFSEVLDQLGLDAQADDERATLADPAPHKSVSPADMGWEALSAGAYYAYVRHPFKDVPSQIVARGLASLVGVLVLPGESM